MADYNMILSNGKQSIVGLNNSDTYHVTYATRANVTPLSGVTAVIDTETVIADDIVLLAGQTTTTENGVYIVKSGAWEKQTIAENEIWVDAGYDYIETKWYYNDTDNFEMIPEYSRLNSTDVPKNIFINSAGTLNSFVVDTLKLNNNVTVNDTVTNVFTIELNNMLERLNVKPDGNPYHSLEVNFTFKLGAGFDYSTGIGTIFTGNGTELVFNPIESEIDHGVIRSSSNTHIVRFEDYSNASQVNIYCISSGTASKRYLHIKHCCYGDFVNLHFAMLSLIPGTSFDVLMGSTCNIKLNTVLGI